MIWLDWLLFGSGHGMKSPYFDDTFYWLKDTSWYPREKAPGNLYGWIGGFGAQLSSNEWRMPAPGAERVLVGKRFRIFNARRKFLRVQCSWSCWEIKTIEDINSFEKHLREQA